MLSVGDGDADELVDCRCCTAVSLSLYDTLKYAPSLWLVILVAVSIINIIINNNKPFSYLYYTHTPSHT